MKLTKFVIAALMAASVSAVTDPFEKQADVMALANKVAAGSGDKIKKEKELKEKEKELTALKWDQGEADKLEQECAPKEAAHRRITASITLGDTENPDDKPEDKPDDKPEDKPDDKPDDKPQDKPDPDLEKKCKEYQKKKAQYEEVKKAKETLASDVEKLAAAAGPTEDELKKLNPGFTPATLDTIKASIGGGPFVFLIPEVDEKSGADQFTLFIAKLSKETKNWETMKGLDEAEAAKGGATAKAYEARVGADNSALKTVKDYQTRLEAAQADIGKDALKGELKVATAAYETGAIKANMLQALSLVTLEPADAEKYKTYATDMASLVKTKTKAEVDALADKKKGDFLGKYGTMLGGAAAVLGALGLGAAYKYYTGQETEGEQ